MTTQGKPPLPPQRRGVEVFEMVTPATLPALRPHHHEELLKHGTNSAKVFWGAVVMAATIASGGFYAGAKFVQLQTEFRTQMANMVTKEDLKEATSGITPACRNEVIAWLQSDGVTVRFPNYHTKNKPYAGKIVDVKAIQ